METLLEILAELHPDVDFETEEHLIDNKILDSFDIVTIVAEINSEYDVAIPAEELNRVFDRFHKTDHSRSIDREGVGLGLYIVKTILEQHKEAIEVVSEHGVTTFAFSLPVEERN